MRRKELYALLATVAVLFAVLLGYFVLNDVGRTAGEVAPEPHTQREEGGENVQDPPPSATGDISDP